MVFINYNLVCISTLLLVIYVKAIIDKTSFLVKSVSSIKLKIAREYCNKKDYETCISFIEDSINLFPTNEAIYSGIAILNTLSIDHISWLEYLLRSNPQSRELYLALGIENHLLGRYVEAIDTYLIIIRSIHSQYGEKNEIIENFEKLQHMSETFISLSFVSDIYFNLAVSYQYMGLIQESSESYITCLTFKTDHISCRLNLAALHHQHGDITAAIYHYEYVLTLFYMSADRVTQPDTKVASHEFKSMLMSSDSSSSSSSSSVINSLSAILTRVTHSPNNQYIMVKSNLGNAYLKHGQAMDAMNTIKSLLFELDTVALHCDCFQLPSLLSQQQQQWPSYRQQLLVSSTWNSSYFCDLFLPKYVYVFVPQMTYNHQQSVHHHYHHHHHQQQQQRNCEILIRDEMLALNNLLLSHRASCYWKYMEEYSSLLLRYTLMTSLSAHVLDHQELTLTRSLSMGPLLPFDTLLLSVSLQTRLIIAYTTSMSYDINSHSQSTSNITSSTSTTATTSHISSSSNHASNSTSPGPRPLRIGFMSYDFNDHPTAHLVEGIFDIVRRKQILQQQEHPTAHGYKYEYNYELIIFSYGKDDGSTFRKQLEQLAHGFYDISQLSHGEATQFLLQSNIHILLDMQLHTYGQRLQIISSHPVNVQISYLVYPGTSGSYFHDYLLSDASVTPPEHALGYSESLLLLPATYQMSFYDRHVISSDNNNDETSTTTSNKHKLRREYNLPIFTYPPHNHPSVPVVVFCNFNKMDKLDSTLTFPVWMNILQRVPGAVLWLLQPTSLTSHKNTTTGSSFDKHNSSSEHNKDKDKDSSNELNSYLQSNLYRVAKYYGVSSHRIIFANRTSKAQHIVRHAAADLFLDTFIYGAHSTATDALLGGLPVLTVRGDSFPSRVVASLYDSLTAPGNNNSHNHTDNICEILLVRTDLKDFENAAVNYAKNIINQYHHQQQQQQQVISTSVAEKTINDNIQHHEQSTTTIKYRLHNTVSLFRSNSNNNSSSRLNDLRNILKQFSNHPHHSPSHSSSSTREGGLGLFNTKQLVMTFLHAMQATYEIKSYITNNNSNNHNHHSKITRQFSSYLHQYPPASSTSLHGDSSSSSDSNSSSSEKYQKQILSHHVRKSIKIPHIIIG